MKVICLIADIVESRLISERGELQKTLQKGLTTLNERSRSNLLSPYTITLGDEFQAVYSSYRSVFQDIGSILVNVYPHRIRFSLSCGELHTEINPKEALGMDGPAFYGAREKLLALKKKAHTIIAVSDSSRSDIDILNSGLLMFSNELSRWKGTTVACFDALMRGKTVRNMTADAQVSARMLYKSIESNNLRDYVEFLRILTDTLEKDHP